MGNKLSRRFCFVLSAVGLASLLVAILTAFLEASRTRAQGPYYVRQGSNGTDCSLANPCGRIQQAVDVANSGDEIRIATGIYTESTGTVVVITKNLTLVGGWDNSFSVRNPLSYPTTLDARGWGRVIAITGSVTVTLDGLRITGGNAAGLGGGPYGEDAGGGIYTWYPDTLFVSNCEIFSNTAVRGGGLQVWNGVIANNLVHDNKADYGGGMAVHYGTTLTGNTIISNTGGIGGGVYLWFSHSYVQGNTIRGNTATNLGGGLYLSHSDGATFSDNLIQDNFAREGGGLSLWYSDHIVLTHNTVQGNQASGLGGGLYLHESVGVMLNACTLQGNTAGSGGGLYAGGSHVILDSTIVAGNHAEVAGGGLAFYSQSLLPIYGHSAFSITNSYIVKNTAGVGGGIDIRESTGHLVNTTVSDNGALTGTAGIRASVLPTQTIAITNTILWGHNGDDLDGNGYLVNYADVEEGVWSGIGNISINPLFADPTGNDYHLRFGSPCIDSGTNPNLATDFDGDSRPFDGNGDGINSYDMGADEWVGTIHRVYLPLVARNP